MLSARNDCDIHILHSIFEQWLDEQERLGIGWLVLFVLLEKFRQQLSESRIKWRGIWYKVWEGAIRWQKGRGLRLEIAQRFQ